GRPVCVLPNGAGMPHHADRPTKTCICCGRPFQWRRKWKTVWDEVRFCSDRCRNEGSQARRRSGGGASPPP
ncbi:MAG: DUF2256 domain-containing protein, partial [Cyanobium sp.]